MKERIGLVKLIAVGLFLSVVVIWAFAAQEGSDQAPSDGRSQQAGQNISDDEQAVEADERENVRLEPIEAQVIAIGIPGAC